MTHQTRDPRPVLTDEFLLANDIPEELFDEMREEIEADLDDCEARGPLSFKFGSERLSSIQGYLAAQSRGIEIEAIGDVEISTWVQLLSWEVHHPPAEVLRNNPIGHIGSINVIGANDDVVAALASHEDLDVISVKGQVTEADVAAAWGDVEAAKGDVISQVNSGLMSESALADLDEWTTEHRVGGELITDAGLRALINRTDLISVSLTGTTVSDDALAEVIPTLSGLTSLTIASDQVTGAFVQALSDLAELEALHLTSPKLTGEHIAALPVFASVTSLWLLGEQAYDGLDAQLLRAAYPNLTHLRVGAADPEADLDDRMLPFLVKFPGVEVNGMTLAPKAIARWAAKRGLSL